MPSFRRRESVIDADRVEKSPQDDPGQRSADSEEALRPAEEAEAKAAEAEAEAAEAEAEAAKAEAIAAAARARAKAIRLRRQAAEAEGAKAQEASGSPAEDVAEPAEETMPDSKVADDADDVDDDVVKADSAVKADAAVADDTAAEDDGVEAPKRSRRLRMPRIRWKIVAAVVAVVLILAFGAASGYMVWQHRLAQQEQQRTAEFTAAARQSVVTLMSLDFNRAQEDVQRIIDNSTGQFKEDFEAQAEDFTQVAKDSKVVTEVTVNTAALTSMTDNNATALVSATSRVTNTAGANQEPRSWRLKVDLVREGDQIKMSKVEFVP
ncbi:hypothetical protein AU193_09295 [Mycobacterium sp. GA-1285]|uniref:hypothetical protein n=1 Tax=Mycobacterium sp. GA-1285 TaxID=1772282 RepID=UPI0007491EE8|nr:hypothetical protein [Mycobacterium sp. GA-1285]KUI16471.1 hypothetical protein AU193_09295 [Mycobacterium sp. GA-1285]